MASEYDARNCQSLIGYAAEVHRRSGGVCQLCGCGAEGDCVDFDLWRQFPVEHVIGSSQGGYYDQIRRAVDLRFQELSPEDRETIAQDIDQMNTVTACSFCNSTTSRNRTECDVGRLIMNTTGNSEEVLKAVCSAVDKVLKAKQASVQWKLESLRRAFRAEVSPGLRETRRTRIP